MSEAVKNRRLPLTTAFLLVVILSTWILLAGPDGWLDYWTGLDFHYLVFPVVLGGSLLLLNRMFLWIDLPAAGQRIARMIGLTNDDAGVRNALVEAGPSVLTRLPLDLGRMVLALGLLSSIPKLPSTISRAAGGGDLASLSSYLEAFDPLATLGIFLLLPFVLLRAAAEAWPDILQVLRFPGARLAAFGTAYVLLADGGVLTAAYDLEGSRILLGLGMVLGFSYGASLLRHFLRTVQPRRLLVLYRMALIIMEGGWMVSLVVALVDLPSALALALADRYPEGLIPHVLLAGTLDRLVAAVLLAIFLIRAVGVFLPVVDRVFGFPAFFLVLLLLVYVLFSQYGILAVAFEANLSQAMAVLILALILSYAASVLRNIASLQAQGRYRRLAARFCGVAGELAYPLPWAMLIWAGLNHLPVVNATLLDHSASRYTGEQLLPHFGTLFDLRNAITILFYAAVLALRLPKAQRGYVPERYAYLLPALVYSMAGYLAWTIGSQLSSLGHGFLLVGVVTAVGMFSLALSHLASVFANSSRGLSAEVAGWLATSKLRVLVFGMSLAFYGLLIRPVLYEFLHLAALYEYAAVLLLMLAVLMRVLNHERVVENSAIPDAPAWMDWTHHQQELEYKPDRRTDNASALGQRFVDHGDWKPLWQYLMGLLLQGEASLESMRQVCRPLRNGAATSWAWKFLSKTGRNRTKRAAALEQALARVQEALASAGTPLSTIDEGAIRDASIPYIEKGVDHDALAVALIAAHRQRGDDLERAVDHWFQLLDAPDPSPGLFRWQRLRLKARRENEGHRRSLVERAISQLFGEGPPFDHATLGTPA